jgi:hypothetical protein
MHVASDDSQYAVAYGCYLTGPNPKDLLVSTYDGVSWTEHLLDTSDDYSYDSKLAWSGTDWGVLFRTSDGLSSCVSVGSTWPTPAWSTLSGLAYNDTLRIELAHDGEKFVGVWEQEDPAYNIFRIYAKANP